MSSCSTFKQNPARVVSKYFNDCKAGMDESLTEFQEPKKNIRGPRTVNLAKPATKPRKKVQKKVKGQKDIKSAFQKNDIVEFTEDFNRICAQSGVDVDAEQLQLAIALSKSLCNTENEDSVNPDNSVPTTSQQRSGKVRSTLLEYGFKVPEVKIDYKSSRRLKIYKKNSLLLLKSAEEKEQNIADRYAQVIFDSLHSGHKNDENIQDYYELSPIYNKATNATYEEISNNKYFYIKDLIDVSTEPVGCLLKDWSSIPGRPKSPIAKPNKNIQVSKLKLSELEIDFLLSGKLEDSQKMVFEKSKLRVSQTQVVKDQQQDDMGSEIFAEDKDTEDESLASNFMNQCAKDHGFRHPEISKELVTKVRSPSPDLFDDDVSVEAADDVIEDDLSNKSEIMLNFRESSNHHYMHEKSLTNKKIADNNEIILTGEISNQPIKISRIADLQSSYDSINEEKIDLTQNSDQGNDVTIVNDSRSVKGQHDNLVIVESSEDEDNETLPYVELSGKKPLHSLYLQNNCYSNSEEPSLIIIDEYDKDNKVEKNETVTTEKSGKSSRGSNFEEYSYNHSDDGNNFKQTIDLTNIKITRKPIIESNSSPDIDLTQSNSSSAEKDNDEILNETNVLETHDNLSIIYDDIIPESENQYDNNYDRIDVSKTDTLGTPALTNDISNLSENRLDSSQKTINTDVESEIFEISDEELNFSVRNSKYNLSQDNISEPEYESPNFDLGGISVINNLSSAQCSINKSIAITNEINEAKNNGNESRNDSFLPAIEIAVTQLKSLKKVETHTYIHKAHASLLLETPKIKLNVEEGSSGDIVNNTPKSSGFIVKTSEVTPLVDYASLTTPERNMELDKFGLKPFKRKRAIQLLTHLYNQTHPIVEAPNEPYLTASPAKKRKPEPTISPRSPQKSPALRKSTPQPGSSSSGAESDVLYEITNFPPLSEVACCPEDWVFQKREKAKVSSCRVPLHIAFHNYVSSCQNLRETILRYEPVNIDAIHRDLVAFGHRYDPKDLLKYLDKKCITVKTTDNSTRNEKRPRQKL